VIIADIEDSTAAVSSGKYEDVNYVGAACITALNNAMPGLDFPKVFGGDGAHAVVPAEHYATVIRVLQQMNYWSRQQFDLHLIIGVVPMEDVVKSGGRLSAGKLRSNTGVDIAMFRGNGLEIAESMVKNDNNNIYQLRTDESVDDPDLTNLSCRWSPITPSRDHMMCIILGAHPQAAVSTDDMFSSVVNLINNIVRLDSNETIPTAADKLKIGVRVSSIKKEMASERGSVWKRALSVLGIHLFAKALFSLKMRVGNFDSQRYQAEIASNSDYIKVVGNVKMVLDCTSSQADEIEALLEAQFQSRQLIYGVFRAEQALMTCLTPDVSSGNHIHYIDGSGGGLWQAATALKRRIADIGSLQV